MKNVTSKNLYSKIEYLIKNKNYRIKLQKNAYKNFKLSNDYTASLIDKLRLKLLPKKINLKLNKNKLKNFTYNKF